MLRFRAIIQKFTKKGEKTGWSYIAVTQAQAHRLMPGMRRSFRVKGRLGSFPIRRQALLPMGDGSFILPFNASMRKGTGKQHGDSIEVELEADNSPLRLNHDLVTCLKDDPAANAFFKTLPPGHQRYFSKWVDDAKTFETRVKRISLSVQALAEKKGFAEMLRSLRRA
ncbi:MAG: hypothetical protein KatS3mg032_0902 [Cyclobacteriaceae bacterium]|nr:MAG: hypothetical protein KatS3mg032_0902 [Cyclobacteriaceae bacterium]